MLASYVTEQNSRNLTERLKFDFKITACKEEVSTLKDSDMASFIKYLLYTAYSTGCFTPIILSIPNPLHRGK